MIQGTAEWHELRRKHLGSSDAPAVMGKSPWKTRYQLWQEKTGRLVEQADTFATQMGNDAEPLARELFEKHFEGLFPAMTLVSEEYPFMMASLDGFHMASNQILEIKNPDREVMLQAKEGTIHDKYIHQVEHQLIVSKASKCFFMCVKTEKVDTKLRIRDKAIVAYAGNPIIQKELIEAERSFWFDHVLKDVAPNLCHEDVLVRSESDVLARYQDLRRVIKEIKSQKLKIDALESDREKIEMAIFETMKHTKEEGQGTGLRMIKLPPEEAKKKAKLYKLSYTGEFKESIEA